MNQGLKERLEQLKLMPADMSGATWLQLEDGIEVHVVHIPSMAWCSSDHIVTSPEALLKRFQEKVNYGKA